MTRASAEAGASSPHSRHPPDTATLGRRRGGRSRLVLGFVAASVWLGAVAVAGCRVAEEQGWVGTRDIVPRVGAAVATWVALVVLTRRAGGRSLLVGGFAGAVLALVTASAENWAIAGAAAVGATTYGVLGMVLTRPAAGLRAARELLVSVVSGLAGAVVVSGYDVELRTLRFRVTVMAFVLVGSLVLAWRLADGPDRLSRRGAALVVGAVLVMGGAVAYWHAIRLWGSPGVVDSIADTRRSVSDALGARPRPVEALVGFPAMVWGVAIRRRSPDGWWACALGALGAGGVASSLISGGVGLEASLRAIGYDAVIGGLLGFGLVALDGLFARRAGHASYRTEVPRVEPRRFSPLL